MALWWIVTAVDGQTPPHQTFPPHPPAHGCDEILATWCAANCPHAKAHGPLLARLGTTGGNHAPAWRCYARVALSADFQQYERGDIFCTRDRELRDVLRACLAARGEGTQGALREGLQPARTHRSAEQECAADANAPAAPLAMYEPTGSERFLAYSVAAHEQLNKQRRALLFYMWLARSLGRTLVLPRVHQVRKDKRAWAGAGVSWFVADGNEYLPMSTVYNVSRLCAYQPAVELAQLWGLPASAPRGRVEAQPHAAPAAERRIDVLFVADGRAGSAGPCAPSTNEIVEFNGVHGVRAAEMRCGLRQSEAALRQLAHARTLGFAHSIDQLPEAQAAELVKHVAFIDALNEAAGAFVSAAFGGEPFLAVHWRRADFKLARAGRPGVLTDVPELIERVRGVMRSRGLRRVYLATDSTDEVRSERRRS